MTPNPIAEEVTINDWPDHYLVPYVIPAAERTAITIVWTTNSPNYISQGAVVSATQKPILDYVNSIPCGLTPLSIYDLETVFMDAADPVLPRESIVSLISTSRSMALASCRSREPGSSPATSTAISSLDIGDLTILEGGQGVSWPSARRLMMKLVGGSRPSVIHGFQNRPIITAEQNLYGGYIINPADGQHVEPPEPLVCQHRRPGRAGGNSHHIGG